MRIYDIAKLRTEGAAAVKPGMPGSVQSVLLLPERARHLAAIVASDSIGVDVLQRASDNKAPRNPAIYPCGEVTFAVDGNIQASVAGPALLPRVREAFKRLRAKARVPGDIRVFSCPSGSRIKPFPRR